MIEITLRKNGMVDIKKPFLGREGESLQENIVVKFEEDFIDGICRIEYENSAGKFFVNMTKEDETYTLPVKSQLTSKDGRINMQIVITELEKPDGIPIYKSNIFYMMCNNSINANVEGEEYETLLDIIEEKIAEVEHLNIETERVSDGVEINITDKTGEMTTTKVYDGEKGDTGPQGPPGEPGDISDVIVNGSSVVSSGVATIENMATTDDIPTKTSDLTNDSGFIDSSYHDDNKQDKDDNSLDTDDKTVVGGINEVNSIAKLANKAKGYTDYQTLITELNDASSGVYNVGQSFLIQTLNVPDLWVISIENTSQTYTYTTDAQFITDTSAIGGVQVGYYRLCQLETLKQDLTNYVKNTDYATQDVGGVVKLTNSYGTEFAIDKKLRATIVEYSDYNSLHNNAFIGKRTLENVITGKGLIKNTDYATQDNAGVIKISNGYGSELSTDKKLRATVVNYSDYNSLHNNAIIGKATLENAITGKELVNQTQLDTKQNTLVSGTNIKTINGNSVLGSGNIEIQGGGGTSDFEDLTNRPSYNGTVMSGSTDIPKVPTKTSDLTNDSGFITNTDYASTQSPAKDGIIKGNNSYGINISDGVLTGISRPYSVYDSIPTQYVISKGTLENVITGKELVNQTQLDTKQDIEDNDLNTDSKTIVGGINEVNSLAKQCNLAKGYTDYQTLITELNSAVVGKNLFDKDNILKTQYELTNTTRYLYYSNTNGKISNEANGPTRGYQRFVGIYVKPNTTYTISIQENIDYKTLKVGTFTNYEDCNTGATANAYYEDLTGTSITLTTGANDSVMFIQVYTNNSSGKYLIDYVGKLQVEESSTATEYEDFVIDPYYQIGQTFYIQTLNVPDLWVISREITKQTYTYTTDAQFITDSGTAGGVQVGYYKLGQLETLKQDLTNYITNTDYAGQNDAGVIKLTSSYGTQLASDKKLRATIVEYPDYGSLHDNAFIGKQTLENVIAGKGLVSNTDYATGSKGGVVRVSNSYGLQLSQGGSLYGLDKTYQEYTDGFNQMLIDKGTLENVITGKGLVSNTDYATQTTAGVFKTHTYGARVNANGDLYANSFTNWDNMKDLDNHYFVSKSMLSTALGQLHIVKTTQAKYDALATKDDTALYIIVG